MTITYRILNNSGELRIEIGGRICAEDELHEAIWLVNIELPGWPAKAGAERSQARIKQYEELLSALRSAGGFNPPAYTRNEQPI